MLPIPCDDAVCAASSCDQNPITLSRFTPPGNVHSDMTGGQLQCILPQ
ncbi:MAG: hypothetical protein H0T76_15285 [Nannocystis sp.]|nr:hypothetical protein [Nannocystis sp.]MBA3547845.1 hypothetical protein [Nannocystis sp.]